MSHSLFDRLFRRKKRGSAARPPSLGDTVGPGTLLGHAGDQEERKPLELTPGAQNAKARTKVNSLFAFMDTADPFTPGEVTGEELPGPILSILSAKEFDSVCLLYTPQTRENAFATEIEIARRHPRCRVRLQQLPVSDPKDYTSLMGGIWRYGRDLLRRSDADDSYVCVSSGTAEMRAIWFLLTTLGIVRAKLLQVATSTQPLFGRVNVDELRLDAAPWQTIRELAMSGEHSGPQRAARGHKDFVLGAQRGEMRKVKEPPAESFPAVSGGRSGWPQRKMDKPEEARVPEEPKSDQEIFEEAVAERMRMKYGDLEAKRRLPNLRLALRVGYFKALYQSSGKELSSERLRDLAREFFEDYEHNLGRRALGGPLGKRRFRGEAPGERPADAVDEGAAGEPPREELPEQAKEEMYFFGDSKPESLKTQSSAAEANPTEAEEDLQEAALGEALIAKSLTSDAGSAEFLGDKLAIPGLDDALQELGIHVGSALLRHAAERAGIAAESDLPVLLLGETGTGKERFAHLIHRMSPRGLRDLVAVNCAAIPEPLAESHLFGHAKGAFSGATSDKKGMFESADQSTLFLDEVAELSLEVQAKLLRVIQDGVVQRLGGTAPRKVDVRVIAASNRDLADQVRVGKFREDLYFRLEVVQIKLPALRERRSEIPELALALLRQINLRRRKPRQLSSAALMRLERYDWPGNVRQLSNVLERSVLYARRDSIDADDLLITDHKPGKDPFTALPEPFPGFKLETFLTQVREQLFLRALAACNGNQTEAAELLGVTKQAVSKFVAGHNDNQD